MYVITMYNNNSMNNILNDEVYCNSYRDNKNDTKYYWNNSSNNYYSWRRKKKR